MVGIFAIMAVAMGLAGAILVVENVLRLPRTNRNILPRNFFLFPESFREDEINTKPNKLNDNSMLLLTIYSNFLITVHCVSGKLNN